MLLDRTCFSVVVVVVVVVDFFRTKFSSQIKLGRLSIKQNETLYVRLVENDNIFEVQSLIICILKE